MMHSKVYIIAEAGVNHNGSRKMAFDLVDVAVKSGADAVKFQTFKAEDLATKDTEKAEYQKRTTDILETHFEMLKRLELSHDLHSDLADYCKNKKIEFLSSAFDLDSLDFLVSKLKLKKLKIPSGEITNAPLLLAHAKTGCNLILSTGMATLKEVEEALGVLAFGLINDNTIKPSRVSFQKAYLSEKGKILLKEKVITLHCTTEYPAPESEINLNAMFALKDAFGLKVGYSDHSKGIAVPIAASAMGAVLIEKHFTLDKSMSGPDHSASLNPNELCKMVESIRIIEKAMGNGIKEPTPSELKIKLIARKSLIATKYIKQGEAFSEENVSIKRPGGGISPMEYWNVIGKVAPYDIEQSSLIVYV
jgi:N-acetylneuraminate synthase